MDTTVEQTEIITEMPTPKKPTKRKKTRTAKPKILKRWASSKKTKRSK